MTPVFESSSPILVIAEIGVNHDGDVQKAKELMSGAKAAGADVVKFQSFKAEELASSLTPKVPYQLIGDSNPTHLSMLKNLELTHQQQTELFAFSKEIGIEFLSTPYSVAEAKFLESLGVSAFKTASADIVDIPLHQYLASLGKAVIASTGMATRAEIEEIVSIYAKVGCELVLMHCTSEYPTPAENSNMQRISTLSKDFKLQIGFSDHSLDETAAVIAVALGSRIFEKHITLNKSDFGPDHAASLNLKEFEMYSNAIRKAERVLGTGNYVRTPAEDLMAQTSRKSLHLSRKLQKGDQLMKEDLVLMRPGTGLFWSEAQKILGKHALRDLSKLHLLSEDDFK